MRRAVLKLFLLLLILSPFSEIQAQVTEAPNHDAFKRTRNKTREKLSYVHVREADVMWHKTIWRRIDMRQKINLPFYYPFREKNGRKNFITMVKQAIEQGELTVYKYDVFDDWFEEPLSIEEAMSTMVDSVTRTDYDEQGQEVTVRDEVPMESQDVYELDIKEQWFFDKHRAVMDVRIIGICPVWLKPTQGGERERLPLFWIYYPEARDVFINAPVFNRHNDVKKLTYEDLFAKRMFDSYVYKESNVYDREIADYAMGIHALLEAKDIENEIRENEMDLWEY
ncbi:MAG: gliding motility protein GldN [Bacteroidales bacterium]